MTEDRSEKIIQCIKIFTIIVIAVIVGLFCLFFIGITKVDAAVEMGGLAPNNNITWWVGYETDTYTCNGNCGSFNKIYIPFYGYQTPLDKTIVFGMQVQIEGTYLSIGNPMNIDTYILWSLDNNTLWNWDLLNSCTVNGTQTTSYPNSNLTKKVFNYTINCKAPTVNANSYPLIYFNVYNGNNTGSAKAYTEFKITKSAFTFNVVDGVDTANIVDSNNQTSQNIIDNQNENTQKITDSVDANTDAINDINDTLNDSSVDNPSSSFNGLENNFPTNSVISDLLLLPVRLYQSVLNSINGTCSSFNLGSLFNHNLTMPCLNINSVLGSTLYGVIDILISGFFILSIRKKFVDIFESFTSLRVGGNELE